MWMIYYNSSLTPPYKTQYKQYPAASESLSAVVLWGQYQEAHSIDLYIKWSGMHSQHFDETKIHVNADLADARISISIVY